MADIGHREGREKKARSTRAVRGALSSPPHLTDPVRRERKK